MPDLYHYIGSDLVVASVGDILTASGAEKTKQRILRRLLTNPGDYIWHPTYGAGLPSFIGKNIDVKKIKALIRSQILLESTVAKQPEPVIIISPILNGIICNITFTYAIDNSLQSLSFNLGE